MPLTRYLCVVAGTSAYCNTAGHGPMPLSLPHIRNYGAIGMKEHEKTGPHQLKLSNTEG